jgi:hypothetical protein
MKVPTKLSDQFGNEIQELLDKQALHELMMRFCRGIDRLDPEVVLSTYHPDAVDDHGPFKGSPEEFVRWMIDEWAPGLEMASHSVTNERFNIEGDVAFGECTIVFFGRLTEQRGVRFGVARYLDRYERRHGEWRISYRTVVSDGLGVLRPENGLPVLEGYPSGRRDREDLSYREGWA